MENNPKRKKNFNFFIYNGARNLVTQLIGCINEKIKKGKKIIMDDPLCNVFFFFFGKIKLFILFFFFFFFLRATEIWGGRS